MSREFKKVLVANRGEIAMRIFRACHDLGLQTIAIYSNEDTYSIFRTAADESYLIGENESPLGAYLDIPQIIRLAKKHGADAIHPGYGFLSENGDFARACEEAGIQFIGPSSKILDLMGDKLSAKQMALACGVPTTPGTAEPLKSREEAQKLAMEFGFPVILKAAAGGGGRGMRRCDTVEEVGINFDLVKSEAKKAFGNDDIFMEKFLVEPKHIEVQVLGDEYGNVVHLFERDCSLQRRYQKVVEFTPAFSVDEKVRQALYDDAVKIAKYVGYVNAGTLEFLVDRDGNHYFIEMNPRIQVEHTVTEMVTGIDLVRSQILIAEGRPLSDPDIGIPSQDAVHLNGYAIQCRVTTEDPTNNFAPDTGKLTTYRSGGGFGIRLDAGNAFTGAEILPEAPFAFRKMRRSRQQLRLSESRAILERNTCGVLALAGDGGYPYALPMSYAYREGKIYFHAARTGHKIDAIARCSKASFCVVDQDKIVPEKFTTHYRSAIAFGRIRVAEDPEEILTGLRALGEKYSPGRDTELEEEIGKELAAVAVLVLTVEHLTGKQAIELVPQPGEAPANEKL